MAFSFVVTAAALAAGLLIGLTGIGGVLLVPVLTQAAGVPLDKAIAASLLGFLIAGIYAAFVHLRRAQLAPAPVGVLCLCAAAGALIGAATLDWLPGVAVRLFIALLCLASGAHALLFRGTSKRGIPTPGALALLGLLVGYASAVSGTGGPVTLIPILLMIGTPAGAAVALGLAAQLPISLAASAVYAFDGRIDPPLAGMLGVLLVAGTYAGARLSSRLSGRRLTVAVAWTLVAVGAWFGGSILVDHDRVDLVRIERE